MTEVTIRKTVLLRASPKQVWAYLTEPEKLAIWFHRPNAPLLEGPYEMMNADNGERFMWGEVQVAAPYTHLEYTFEIAPLRGAASLVRWTLSETEAGTQLSLEHSGLPQGAEAFDLSLALDKGWEEHMASMRADLHG